MAGKEGGREGESERERGRDPTALRAQRNAGAMTARLRPGRAAACALTRRLPHTAAGLPPRTGRTAAACTLRVARRRRPLQAPSLNFRRRLCCRFLPVVSLPCPPFHPFSGPAPRPSRYCPKEAQNKHKETRCQPSAGAPPAVRGRNDTASKRPLTAAVAGCRTLLGLLRLAPGRRLSAPAAHRDCRLLQVPSLKLIPSRDTALGPACVLPFGTAAAARAATADSSPLTPHCGAQHRFHWHAQRPSRPGQWLRRAGAPSGCC